MTRQWNILLVDDEAYIMRSLKRLFRKENYVIHTASSGAEGLEILKSQPVQLVISDYRMPEMTGVEFLKAAKEIAPKSTRAILSGYAESSAIIDAINQGEIYRFFTKPWNDEDLKISIRQCLDHHDLVEQTEVMIQKEQSQNKKLEELNASLEQKVNEKTKSLEFFQQVFSHLPYPVLGVSKEGMVALINEKGYQIIQAFNYSIFPGIHISETFPDEINTQIKACLNGNQNSSIIQNKIDCKIHFEILTENNEITGGLLLLLP